MGNTSEYGGPDERRAGVDGDGDAGERVADVVDRLEDAREDDRERRRRTEDGVVPDQLDEVEDRLLAFGRALGGDPDDVDDLPFTEEAGRDGMPEPLYVRHDREMLNQVTSWLLQGQHIGLISPRGTGKTAFREILRRDPGRRDDFVVAHVTNPRNTTARGLYEMVLRAAAAAGYEIDPSEYWQVRDASRGRPPRRNGRSRRSPRPPGRTTRRSSCSSTNWRTSPRTSSRRYRWPATPACACS